MDDSATMGGRVRIITTHVVCFSYKLLVLGQILMHVQIIV
jgi:hypothetical protein